MWLIMIYIFCSQAQNECATLGNHPLGNHQRTRHQRSSIRQCTLFINTAGFLGSFVESIKEKKQKPLNFMQISQNRTAQCGVIRSVMKYETQYLGAVKWTLCSRLYGRPLSACRHKLDYHVWWLSSLWIGGSETEGFTNTCIQGADPPHTHT